MTESNMEKHTLTIGSARMGETVRFTAEVLGKTHVNGGAGGSLDVTFYQLPDHTYRVLMETEDASMLEPSNMSEALPIGEPAEYGSFTLEEIHAHDLYGPALEALMKVRTEGESRKNTVRDLDWRILQANTRSARGSWGAASALHLALFTEVRGIILRRSSRSGPSQKFV